MKRSRERSLLCCSLSSGVCTTHSETSLDVASRWFRSSFGKRRSWIVWYCSLDRCLQLLPPFRLQADYPSRAEQEATVRVT
ncbi:hypothetical protein BD309DRAFT_963025 [Dichomitus squalens]|nr:hypothetical protein BD309DRAFT_963025 [Dichomitus squalens]